MSSDGANYNSDFSYESKTFVEAILSLLRDGMEKLKISLIIPKLLENKTELKEYMDEKEYKKFIDLCSAYTSEAKRVSFISRKRSKAMKDLFFIEIIDNFHQNRKLIYSLPESFTTLDSHDMVLIETFEELSLIAEQRLKRSAASELLNERKIYDLYHENERIKGNILSLMDHLSHGDVVARWKIKAKQALIKKYEQDLAIARWDNNIKIKRDITLSSQHLREVYVQSKQRVKVLTEELEKNTMAYEQNLKKNLKAEKDLRDEKNKLLLQLQGIIRKYDENMSSKSQENIELQDVYDEEKRKFDEFMIIFDREEEEYNELVTRKIKEIERERVEKQMLFMMNRAARIIQAVWGKYLIKKRKEEAKTKKKSKKKK